MIRKLKCPGCDELFWPDGHTFCPRCDANRTALDRRTGLVDTVLRARVQAQRDAGQAEAAEKVRAEGGG